MSELWFKTGMSGILVEFLLAIIMVIFLAVHFVTGIYIFGQIAVTVALVNFAVSTIRCIGQERRENE